MHKISWGNKLVLKNLANFITFTRVIFAPILAIYFFSSFNEGNNIILVLIFVLASVTDFLDGFVARRLNQVSLLGKFLDPVADKVLVITALLLILYNDTRLLIFIPVFLIIFRELMVSALREWSAILNSMNSLNVNFLGKLKTTVQLVSIAFLLYKGTLLDFDVYAIGILGIYIAAFLSVISMVKYLVNFFNEIR
ncbi:MAG: CDP-diacylglycerol--glycerol-3-phosphate 3-phosphatidyltransferase [Gammaproteobacteria bacterium]|nr:CDP-diacylglycerol--glycerol-3-phosphate 3-phosphatidyltransferase [Gammaproteobacteria bacterium]